MSDIEEDKVLAKTKKENTIKFIHLVQQEPILWNTNHPDYKCHKKKDKVWQKLEKELGFATSAKYEWKKLRDIFRDSLKRRRFKSLQPWMYGEHMAFLIPYMNSKKVDELPCGTLEEQPDNELNFMPITPDVKTEPVDNSDNMYIAQLNADTDQSLNFMPITPDAKTEPVDNSDNMYIAQLNADTDQSLKNFFSSMYDGTKLLPKLLQAQVKRKIFEAVTEAEEQFLKSQTSQAVHFQNMENDEMESKYYIY